MTEIEACATGCTTWHGEDLHYRAADVGHLCSSCDKRIRYRLAEAPAIIRQLRSSIVPLRAIDTTRVRVDASRDAPIPFDDGMLEAADELYATLCNWALSHAQTMGAVGGLPEWLSRAGRAEKDMTHLGAVLSAETAAQRVGEVVAWLDGWGAAIAHSIAPASLKAYHDDIVDLIKRTRGRAGLSKPRKPRLRALCEVCGEAEGEVDVPDIGPIVARCTNCHTIYPIPEMEAAA